MSHSGRPSIPQASARLTSVAAPATPRPAMGLAREARAAVGSLTVFERVAAGAPREALAGGLVFYPAVGLCLGVLAAATALAADRVRAGAGGLVGFAVLTVLSGARPP